MCKPLSMSMGFLQKGEEDKDTESTDTKLTNFAMDPEDHELDDDYDEDDVDEDLEDEDDDDSCSDQSSTTSTSTSNNQRVDGGRVCDCCYCEVFGHGMPAVAPTSRNYNEMRERLRSRLNKRKAERGRCENPANLHPNGSDKRADLVEKEDNRDLEELLNFIEGTSSRNTGNVAKGKKKKDRQKKKKERQKDRKILGSSTASTTTTTTTTTTEDTSSTSSMTSTNTSSSNTNETLISISANTETNNRENQKHVYSDHRNCDHGYSSFHRTITSSKTTATSSPSSGQRCSNGITIHSVNMSSNVNNNRKNQPRNNNNNDKTSHSDNNCLKPTNHSPQQLNGEYSPKYGKKCDNKMAKSLDKKNNEDNVSPDEVFLPKSDIDLENGELDEIEKEVEAFKRFCFNSVPRARKDKVNVDLKDILIKKRPLTTSFESERISMRK